MKKYLLIISIVLISLFAVGAVSASDNITDDSVIQEANPDVNEQLEIEESNLISDETASENLTNAADKDIPIVNVEDVTIKDYEQPTIPFNVTDSNGNLIPGEVIVTVYGLDDDISKYVVVSPQKGIDSFRQLDLNSIDEFNNGLDILDVYNIIYSTMNSTNFNPALLMSGLSDIYKGIDLNASRLILDLVDSDVIDISKDGDKLKAAIGKINASDFNYIYALSDAVTVNKTAFMNSLNVILNGFNKTDGDISTIIEKFTDYLNLEIPFLTMLEAYAVLNGNEIIRLHDVLKIVRDIYTENQLTMSDIADALDYATDGAIFDIPSIIRKAFDANSSDIKEGLSEMVKSFHVDAAKASDIITGFDFNKKQIADELSDITGISSSIISNIVDGIADILNGITSNKTYASKWIESIIEGNYEDIASRILNLSEINASKIKAGFDKIIPEINFKVSTLLTACNFIESYGDFNSSLILGGLDKVIIGLGGNVSQTISKAYDLIGYRVSFPYGFKEPGVYNITVKYIENDRFTSASTDARLIIIPSQDYTINAYINEMPERYGDETRMSIFLNDGYGNGISGVLNVSLNGKKIDTVETDRGYCNYIINNLTSGKYVIEFEYCNTSEKVDLNVNVATVASKIICSDMKTVTVNEKVDGKIGKYFKIQLKDENGKALSNKTVLIGYNGNTYKRLTDKNGELKLQINLQKAGSYSISACYLGDDVYGASYAVAKIKVEKQTAKLTAQKKTFKAKAKKKIIKATFKSAKGHAIKGKVIKFTVKGKTYTAKTNKKGQASVNVKLTKKGTYKVTVRFAGDDTYKKATKKVTLKIK